MKNPESFSKFLALMLSNHLRVSPPFFSDERILGKLTFLFLLEWLEQSYDAQFGILIHFWPHDIEGAMLRH